MTSVATHRRLVPAILAGGSGTRLWPYSRKAFPKQFLPLVPGSSESLFQATLRRMDGGDFAPALILGNEEHRFLIAEQLRVAEAGDCSIVLEPVGRNTAPSALVAALLSDPSDIILLMPSDHHIPDAAAFRTAVMEAAEAAIEGQLVTFGVRPTGPETGYGYLETTSTADGNLLKVLRFVEKPDRETAEAYLQAGNYLWNAGIFMFEAQTLIDAFAEHAPQILDDCRRAVEKIERDHDFLRLPKDEYAQCENISIDYAIMEKADNIVCKPLDIAWSDLGSWDAVWQSGTRDENGNCVTGDVLLHQVENSLAMQVDGPCLSLVGVKDLVVVSTRDAVLVASRADSQAVRNIVDHLCLACREEADQHVRVYRPWGWYERLSEGDRYQVKCLQVKSGERLSLQSHHHRAEHWVVVQGTVRVTNGDKTFLLTENQSTYIPIGARHRLENPGKLPALLIEVQSGAYLGEDDIVRYSDDYGRTRGSPEEGDAA